MPDDFPREPPEHPPVTGLTERTVNPDALPAQETFALIDGGIRQLHSLAGVAEFDGMESWTDDDGVAHFQTCKERHINFRLFEFKIDLNERAPIIKATTRMITNEGYKSIVGAFLLVGPGRIMSTETTQDFVENHRGIATPTTEPTPHGDGSDKLAQRELLSIINDITGRMVSPEAPRTRGSRLQRFIGWFAREKAQND